MAFKFVTFAALLALARSSAVVSPIAYGAVSHGVVNSEYDPNPQYTYSYDVHDSITGDSKSQIESRSGDVVQGQYSLNDADGTRRTVDYVADPVNGFNAVVSKTPLVNAPVVAAAAPAVVSAKVAATPVVSAAPVYAATPVVATKVAASVPVVSKVVAPSAYSAPVAYSAYSAPVAYSGYAHPYKAGYVSPVAASYGYGYVSPYSYSAYNPYYTPYSAYSAYSPYIRAGYY